MTQDLRRLHTFPVLGNQIFTCKKEKNRSQEANGVNCAWSVHFFFWIHPYFLPLLFSLQPDIHAWHWGAGCPWAFSRVELKAGDGYREKNNINTFIPLVRSLVVHSRLTMFLMKKVLFLLEKHMWLSSSMFWKTSPILVLFGVKWWNLCCCIPEFSHKP
jgi:hypothetical protein